MKKPRISGGYKLYAITLLILGLPLTSLAGTTTTPVYTPPVHGQACCCESIPYGMTNNARKQYKGFWNVSKQRSYCEWTTDEVLHRCPQTSGKQWNGDCYQNVAN